MKYVMRVCPTLNWYERLCVLYSSIQLLRHVSIYCVNWYLRRWEYFLIFLVPAIPYFLHLDYLLTGWYQLNDVAKSLKYIINPDRWIRKSLIQRWDNFVYTTGKNGWLYKPAGHLTPEHINSCRLYLLKIHNSCSP